MFNDNFNSWRTFSKEKHIKLCSCPQNLLAHSLKLNCLKYLYYHRIIPWPVRLMFALNDLDHVFVMLFRNCVTQKTVLESVTCTKVTWANIWSYKSCLNPYLKYCYLIYCMCAKLIAYNWLYFLRLSWNAINKLLHFSVPQIIAITILH